MIRLGAPSRLPTPSDAPSACRARREILPAREPVHHIAHPFALADRHAVIVHASGDSAGEGVPILLGRHTRPCWPFRKITIISASITSWAVIEALIDHPTTRRENGLMTVAI
jgi:hypothetical protein